MARKTKTKTQRRLNTPIKKAAEPPVTEEASDSHNELFISPELTDATRILGVLGHEMAHATVGTAAGHKKPFKLCALAIGLQGPMRATTESPVFVAWAATLVKR